MDFARIRQNRSDIDLDLRESQMRQYFSPAMFCLHRAIVPRLKTHASGKLLDAGCGTMPFRVLLEPLVDEYHTLDIERRIPEVHFVADLQDMRSILSESYDVVLCTEVVEHVPQPEKLMSEVWRILKPQGKFILSVPYLSRLHEEPFDYYRFTKYGLQFLLEKNGFSVVEIVPTGSLFSFIGHQISTVIVGSLWHVPLLKQVVFFLNALFCTLPCYVLDKSTGMSSKFPLGYVVVAEKVEFEIGMAGQARAAMQTRSHD